MLEKKKIQRICRNSSPLGIILSKIFLSGIFGECLFLHRFPRIPARAKRREEGKGCLTAAISCSPLPLYVRNSTVPAL